MNLQLLSKADIEQKLSSVSRNKKYFAMYSSLFDGIVTEQSSMLIPIDDHMVHRGDGVFEVFRMSYGAIYDLNSHIKRLHRSAKAIELELPKSDDEIREIIRALFRYCLEDSAMVRLYVSRGPGGFTTNPYETIGSQLYIVITEFAQLSSESYERGVRVQASQVAMKPSPWHQIKSCNYLPNVMMKKEAKDRGVDFTVSVTSDGFLAEGSTENIAIIVDNELLIPSYDYTLRGTTLNRVAQLATDNMTLLNFSAVKEVDIPVEALKKADEVFFIGTTLEVLPVSEFNGEKISSGKVGERCRQLRQLLIEDMKFNEDFRTVIR